MLTRMATDIMDPPGYSILKIGTDGKNEIINTGSLHGINKIYSDGDNIWALADDGVGYISSKGNVTAIGGTEL